MKFARRHFTGHQILVCTHTDGHNESGNIHVHIIFNSVRKLDVEKEPYMERDIDCRAGYKHHLTKGYLEYFQAEVMEMCEREGLRQVDLLSPTKTKNTGKEYRAKQRGQEKLDKMNEKIIAAQMKPRTIVFQIQKQYLRDAVSDAAPQAASIEEFKKLIHEKYGIEVKDRRGRFSYLHPERGKFITGRALGSDFEKEHVEEMIRENASAKEQQNASYARRVKLSNLKEMAKTLIFVQEHGFDTREELLQHQRVSSDKEAAVSVSLNEASAKLRETNARIHYTGQYYASRSVHARFLNSGNKKTFREAHKAEPDQYNEAIHFF